eukprot:gene19753-25685_t
MSEFSYVVPILERLSTEKIESDYKVVNVRGVPQNPTVNVELFEHIIDNFETHDNDVFVATFVKAGTTWTQQIIHQLLRKGESGGFYGESCPWLEATSSEFLQPREAPTWTLEKINNTPGPRYFKTHATVKDLPRGQAKIKIIYVARNPKDSVVSLYHHAKSKPEFGYTGDFETFVQLFLVGKAENGSWFDHVLDWYKECQTHPDTHLFLKYEDMYQDTAAAVKQIAEFLGFELTDEILDKVVKNSSLNEMRQSASIGLNHLRKGGYGGWRSVFTVGLSEFFDDVYLHKFEGSDLKFNFGPNSKGIDQIF